MVGSVTPVGGCSCSATRGGTTVLILAIPCWCSSSVVGDHRCDLVGIVTLLRVPTVMVILEDGATGDGGANLAGGACLFGGSLKLFGDRIWYRGDDGVDAAVVGRRVTLQF